MPEPTLGPPEKTVAEYQAEARQKKAATLAMYLRADGITAEEAGKKDAAYWKCLAERADVRSPSPATIKLVIKILSEAAAPPRTIIYAFDRQHKIGSICAAPCAQCGDGETGTDDAGCEFERIPLMTDDDGAHIYPQPLLIKREVTREEYVQQAQLANATPVAAEDAAYYYEVSTD